MFVDISYIFILVLGLVGHLEVGQTLFIRNLE